MRLFALSILLSASLLLVSCGRRAEDAKYKTYLYKQPNSDGLVCVFYSTYPVAEQNARMFATMHQDKYGVALIVRTEPY